ncbi:hypothetical protein GW17_00005981 [Ensete ventricosum]|nr:hypothetical protein GW17_00005981 [Ensete ventricosum]
MWQELQAKMDKLFETRHKEREVLTGGRANHSSSPLHHRKQVVSHCNPPPRSDR